MHGDIPINPSIYLPFPNMFTTLLCGTVFWGTSGADPFADRVAYCERILYDEQRLLGMREIDTGPASPLFRAVKAFQVRRRRDHRGFNFRVV